MAVTEFKDVDVAVSTTTAKEKTFSIESFLAAASKLDESTFKKFKANAAIIKYCAGILVPPSMVVKRLSHWKVSKSNKPQPNKNQTATNKKLTPAIMTKIRANNAPNTRVLIGFPTSTAKCGMPLGGATTRL